MVGADESEDEPATTVPVGGAGPHRLLVGVATSPGVGVGRAVVPSSGPAQGPMVVVAPDLSAGDVMGLDVDAVHALATAAGAPLSHAAILARSRGIPAVTGLGPTVLEIPAGTLVLVDGDAGTVHIAPPAAAVEAARARRRAALGQRQQARLLAAGPALTSDGVAVAVWANVGSRDDAVSARREGAEGIGMLRTEFAFLNLEEPPGEEEQYHAYRGIAEAIGDLPLVVRTLDLGADIPAWGTAPEPNPALGNRGLRLTLKSPELFATQLRAIVRLGEERPVSVMFPMVTTVEELRQARALLDATRKASPGNRAERTLPVGITVEVPAAALTAETFAPLVDFFAVGSNDLTQYTLAADRANAAVAGLADGLHPAVLRLIREVTAAGERHRRPVEVVGELASDPLAIPVLLGLGVTTLSVRPNAVAAVKQVVRAVAIDQARHLADATLKAESAAAVRALASQPWRWSGRPLDRRRRRRQHGVEDD